MKKTNATQQDLIPRRALGKTGEKVSIYGLGGLYCLMDVSRHHDAVEIINRAIDLGVNYLDTSAAYGFGASELAIGAVMAERRDEVFLATKCPHYTYDGAMSEIKQSLGRLQTDHIDLYQHHYLGGRGQLAELQTGHSAREAFEDLRKAGTIRYVGVTGHSMRILADALEDYPYDCCLVTLNPANVMMDTPEDLDRFFRVAQEREVGVIAMKVVGRGDLVRRGIEAGRLLNYALSFPVTTAVVGISEIAHLEENIALARAFEPMTQQDMSAFRQEAQTTAD